MKRPGPYCLACALLLSASCFPIRICTFGKAEVSQIRIADFGGALDAFREDTRRYPTTLEGLQALIQDPGIEGWDGPYLKKNRIPHDPWGRPYQYRSPGLSGRFDLWSYGKDGEFGGADENADIASWLE